MAGSDGVKIPVDAPGAKEAAEKLKGVKAEVNATGEAAKLLKQNVTSAGNSLLSALGGEGLVEKAKKIGDSITAVGNSSLTMGTRVGAGIGVLGLAASQIGINTNLIGTLATKTYEYVVKTDEASRVSSQLVGGYREVAKATHNVVTAQQALADQQAVLSKGFELQSGQLATMERAAQGISPIYGQATASVSSFASAVASGDNNALAAWGVHLKEGLQGTQALSEATRQLQNNLNNLHPPQLTGFVNNAGDLAERFGRLLGTGNEVTSFEAQQRRYQDAMVRTRQELQEQTRQEGLAQEAAQRHHQALVFIGTEVENAGFNWKAYREELAKQISTGQQVTDEYHQGRASLEDYVLSQQRTANATRELEQLNQRLAQSFGDVKDAIDQTSLKMAEGETAAQRNARYIQARLEQAREQLGTTRLQQQLDRQVRAQLSREHLGVSRAQISSALGLQDDTGQMQAVLQQRREAKEVIEQLALAGIQFEIFGRKAHQTVSQYYQGLRTTAQQALDTHTALRDKLQAEHDLEKQLAQDVRDHARATEDFNRELEKRSLLMRQQAAESRAGIGQQSLNEALASGARGQLGFNDVLSTDRTAQRQAIIEQIRSFQELAAASPQNDILVQQMNQQAQALQNVVTQYDALRRSQSEAMDVGLQFTQAFRQNTDITNTGAQALSQTFSGAFSNMTGALRTHLKAVIEGKEEFGAALQAMLHETLLNLATESAVQAIFQTALAIAAFATYRPAEGAQHLAAAGVFAATAILAGGGAALTATQAQAPAASSASSPSKGYASNPASVPPSNNSQQAASLTINLNGTIVGSNDGVGKVIAEQVNRQLRLGNIQIRKN